ncbi:MAG: YjbF family lipoprotein [Planktomarina sp.]
MKKVTLFMAALVFLSACGNMETQDKTVGQMMIARAKAVVSRPAPTTAVAPEPWTRAGLTAAGGPVILAYVPSRKAQASLGLAQESRGTRTYLSADGISLMIQNGILTGTRGFGDDLMSAGDTGLWSNLRRGSGSHTRVLRHLNGLDGLDVLTLSCTVTSQGVHPITILGKSHRPRLMVETCTGGTGPIHNKFLIENGSIVQSVQWISPSVDQIIIEQVQ